jgi:hypothetical protein
MSCSARVILILRSFWWERDREITKIGQGDRSLDVLDSFWIRLLLRRD